MSIVLNLFVNFIFSNSYLTIAILFFNNQQAFPTVQASIDELVVVRFCKSIGKILWREK